MGRVILVGGQSWTEEDLARYRRRLDAENERRKRPDVRARRTAYMREWRARNRERYNAYQREWMRRWRAA